MNAYKSILNYDRDFVKLSPDQKINVNNDNTRRYFDTVLAKKTLEKIGSDKGRLNKLKELHRNVIKAYKQGVLKREFSDWESACKKQYQGTDGRLHQLETQIDRSREAISNLEISDDADEFFYSLYCGRYLNYLIDETDTYKKNYPENIIKSKSDPYYHKRGRLDGDFQIVDSRNTGILRNHDVCSQDLLLKNVPEKRDGIDPGLYSRCPDRLNLADPGGMVDNDPDSWLSNNFNSGNTPYVNGMSGSMLIEIRALICLKEYLKGIKDNPQADFLNDPSMIEVMNDYFTVMGCMYTYIDGGHSLFEIQSSFKQPWVASAFINQFEDKRWGKVGQELYHDKEVFKNALHATQQFDQTLRNKYNVMHEVESFKSFSTHEMALKQTKAARALLYYPNHIVLEQLTKAASNLAAVFERLSPDNKDKLVSHLNGESRLVPGERPEKIIERLRAVGSEGPENALNIAVAIALMGDIGGYFTTPHNASISLMSELKNGINDLGLSIPDDNKIQSLKTKGGSQSVGPTKKNERELAQAVNYSVSGIHNTGDEADNLLNINKDIRLPKQKWARFNLNSERLKNISEPLVGHMSASPFEILQSWDMLVGEKSEKQCNQSVDDVDAVARAAATSAFLIGLGFHSAVEVSEGIFKYLGKDFRSESIIGQGGIDMADLIGDGNATSMISDLCNLYQKK